jgi:hypothetical protein
LQRESEGELVSEIEPPESLPRRGEMASNGQTPPLSKRRPHFKTRKSLERTKIWSWVPTGPDTKHDCAGEASSNLLDWTVE